MGKIDVGTVGTGSDAKKKNSKCIAACICQVQSERDQTTLLRLFLKILGVNISRHRFAVDKHIYFIDF